MGDLRAVPRDRVCPECKAGRLIHNGSPTETKPGPYLAVVYFVCDVCGFRPPPCELPYNGLPTKEESQTVRSRDRRQADQSNSDARKR